MEKLTEFQLNFDKGSKFNKEIYLNFFNIDWATIEDFKILEDNDVEILVEFKSSEEQFDEIRTSIETDLDLDFGFIDFYVDLFDDSDELDSESSEEN